MIMTQKTQKTLRLLELLGLIVALAGPWVFERIHVPAGHECSVRLADGFCATPLPGFLILTWAFATPLMLLALPLFSYVLLLIDVERWRLGFHWLALATAVLTFLIWMATDSPALRQFDLRLWGRWLYLVMLLDGLGLELLFWWLNRRDQPAQPAPS